MKKVFYGPLFRTAMRMVALKKIIGQASKDEIEELAKKVSKTITRVSNNRREDDIYHTLCKKLKIIYTEQLPAFSGTAGMALNNAIFVDKIGIDEILSCSEKELEDNYNYATLVHECIHKLQEGKLEYKGKSIRGFIEGATDLYAMKASRRNRSSISDDGSIAYNFPSSGYDNLVSLLAQFEILFGQKIVENFTLSSKNMELIEKIQEELGKETYEALRKDMNLYSQKRKSNIRFQDWQNVILKSYFNKRIEYVNTREEAEQLLEQLNELQTVRIRAKGDNSYQAYYETYFNQLKERFPNLNAEQYQYKEFEFYPILYEEERIAQMDSYTLSYALPKFQTVDELKKYDINQCKRYRLDYDNKIIEAIIEKEKVISLASIDKEGVIREHLYDLIGKGIAISDAFRIEDGKVLINTGFLIGEMETEEKKHQMEEIPLNVTKKQMYEMMLEDEENEIRFETFFEKIKRIINKPKRLPPYSEIKHELEDKQRKTDLWQLNDKERKEITPINSKGNSNREHPQEDIEH